MNDKPTIANVTPWPRMMRIPVAAQYIGATNWFVEELLRNELVPSSKMGDHKVVDKEDLDKWLAEFKRSRGPISVCRADGTGPDQRCSSEPPHLKTDEAYQRQFRENEKQSRESDARCAAALAEADRYLRMDGPGAQQREQQPMRQESGTYIATEWTEPILICRPDGTGPDTIRLGELLLRVTRGPLRIVGGMRMRKITLRPANAA